MQLEKEMLCHGWVPFIMSWNYILQMYVGMHVNNWVNQIVTDISKMCILLNCTERWGSCFTRRERSREDDYRSLFSTGTCIPINWKVCVLHSFFSSTFFSVQCFSNSPCSMTARAYVIPLLIASQITTWLSLFLCWRDLWYFFFVVLRVY